MANLWMDRKPCEFLAQSGAHAFKIIQTSKGRRKLVAYFTNWETTLKALDIPPVFSPTDKKKSGNTGNVSVSNQSKKKDKQQSSTKASQNNNELKNPTIQKKAKKKSQKNGGGGSKDNKEIVLAEILSLLRKLV
ncbi:unnamed protein product [Rhizophagus irregularis]|nr:unnamed protein product [Rhizophagus irregularis]